MDIWRHSMRPVIALTLVWLVLSPATRWQSSAAPLPVNTEAIMRKVRDAARLDYEIQKEFTYLERRRDIRLSTFGKVTVGPLRTFEVYPSPIPGRTFKRLIEVDGKPLTAQELARREAEHQKDLREQEERRRAETPRQREQSSRGRSRRAARARGRPRRRARGVRGDIHAAGSRRRPDTPHRNRQAPARGAHDHPRRAVAEAIRR